MPHTSSADRYSVRRLAIVRAIAFLLLASFVAIAQANDIIYVHDEIGRLIAVINPAGETATYTYDGGSGTVLLMT